MLYRIHRIFISYSIFITYIFCFKTENHYQHHPSFIIFSCIHCGTPAVSHFNLISYRSTQYISHFAQSILCSMFHNSQTLLFSILSSLCPSHPVNLSFPCLFLSNSSSCPPPLPLSAAPCITTTPISTRLPTDSQTVLCRRGRETYSGDLCHSAKFLKTFGM